mgnify:CR=1 FL=1
MSTWAFRRPVTRFKAGDKVEIIRSLNVPGVGTFHTGDVGVVKSVSPSGEPLIEVSGKEPFYANPAFLKKAN